MDLGAPPSAGWSPLNQDGFGRTGSGEAMMELDWCWKCGTKGVVDRRVLSLRTPPES